MIEKLYRMLIRNGWLVVASVALILVYSCQEEMEVSRQPITGDEILFAVTADSVWNSVSRSASTEEEKLQFLCDIGEDSLYIGMIEEENDIFPFVDKADSTETRAASLLSESLTNFKLTAILNTNTGFMNNTLVTRDPSTGNCTYSPVKYWPNDLSQKIHFFGYAQTAGTAAVTPTFQITEEGGNPVYKGTFSYTLPDTDTSEKDDATRQPDLVFAVTPEQNKANNPVNLKFQHALAAVVFKIKNIPDNVVVNTIEFKGVNSTGTCTMKGAGDALSFTWASSTPKDYIQNFGHEVTATPEINEMSSTANEKCFMMIPQEFSDEATLNIYITINGRTYAEPLSRKLNTISSAWLANKKYTYTISLPEEVEVFVDDDVDDAKKIKSGLEIKNTGLSPIYVRVAIIGNWKNETTEQIVADWRNSGNSETDDGEFDWGGGVKVDPYNDTTPVRNWLKGPDGFYYYTQELARGKSVPDTDKLFDTYQLKVQSPPVPNAVLDLTIAVQAMRKEDLQKKDQYGYSLNIWPPEITTIIFND